MDMLIVVDDSGSIGSYNYLTYVRPFVAQLIG